MPLVKVKEKYQVTLPTEVHRKAGLAVGDVLEAAVEGKKITLTPKVAVGQVFIERRLAEAEEDIKKGRVYGPFRSVGEMSRSLHKKSKPKASR
ncbi:MAG: AbrB/MazE/SpoVT family DNA-binding domain-containing protein [Deltaproteobacteria bacterium]|nr:AbrB/MazE/SpoVT family DNA-binding domain-containing protein [Deltaproteobacteria bacterium]